MITEVGFGQDQVCSKKLGISWCGSIDGTIQDAIEMAKDKAALSIKDKCENGKSGKLKAKPVMGNENCSSEMNSDQVMVVTCKPVFRATCILSTPETAKNDPRVSDSRKPKARILTDSDGNRYLIDEKGDAHPIESSATDVSAAAAR